LAWIANINGVANGGGVVAMGNPASWGAGKSSWHRTQVASTPFSVADSSFCRGALAVLYEAAMDGFGDVVFDG